MEDAAVEALLKRYEEEGDHLLDQIVTGDESWCYHYDPSTKRASMEWKRGDSPRPKKSGLNVRPSYLQNCRYNSQAAPPDGDRLKLAAPPLLTLGRRVSHSMMQQKTLSLGIAASTTCKSSLERRLNGVHMLVSDGAPPHYHRDVRAYLDQNLSGQWIGRRGPIEFPARSPDLTPLDFFLWGTVKDGVYKRKPRNLDILWNEIQAVCREISLDVLIRCTESVVTRTQNCIDAAGHQFEQY
ncbi:hypothetical protein LAZ67_7002848 [Cordylochernes scorpioides]|uniref:Tc1-like transposase DDE domain-containing protein n=1 Tax=Cordylochernes scorpioides TaxID=51811 RepID=A0ABY6KNF8_9ARAC|nr:hypothetical protein LAZ67_7002848 [Cordylochernes scorpioides]